MSRTGFSVPACGGADLRAEAAQALRKAIALRKQAGLKAEHAIESTADWFGMMPRRVRMWIYNEIVNPPADQCEQIISRWWAHRKAEIVQTRINLEHMEDEFERDYLRRYQLELPLRRANGQNNKNDHRANSSDMESLNGRLDRAASAAARYQSAWSLEQ